MFADLNYKLRATKRALLMKCRLKLNRNYATERERESLFSKYAKQNIILN